jgi:hypothetical protein
MVGVDSEENHPFVDLYRCGACEVEQAVHWGPGERLLVWEDDQER